MKTSEGFGSRLFTLLNTIFLTLTALITLYPMIYILAVSLSSPQFVKANMVNLYPIGLNVNAYIEAFHNKFFWIGYKNTIVYTVLATFINIALTTTMGFSLSRKELVGRKFFTIFVIMTMYFSGGMIPNFLLIKWLHFYNSIWAVVLPGAISTFNLIIMRTYMEGIPEEIIESVRIDGANELKIFMRIILPLSKPVIATLVLFYAVSNWNAYFGPMIYLKDRLKYPLQVILKEMIGDQNNDALISAQVLFDQQEQQPTSEMLISASIVVSLIPILCVYPFIQRYFVQGVMIGSVKG